MRIKKLGLVGNILLGIGCVFGSAEAANLNVDVLLDPQPGDMVGGRLVVKHLSNPASSEGQDKFDALWNDPVLPDGIDAQVRPTTSPYGIPLIVDTRPANSTSSVYANIIVRTRSGQTIEINTGEYIRFGVDDSDGNFVGKPIICQLQDGKRYDVRSYPRVNLPDLNSVYNNDEIYYEVAVHFRNLADFDNNGKVDFEDFALLSKNWQHSSEDPISNSPNYLLGDISGIDDKADGYVGIEDLAALALEWLQEFPEG